MIQTTHAAVSHTTPSRPRSDHVHHGRAAGPVAPDHASMLQLQRAAGNRGVTSLMHAGTPTVQRGLFDMLGGLLGGGGGLRDQLGGLAGQGAQMGMQALGGSLGGPLGGILSGAGAGLGGVATSLVGGDTQGALSGLQGLGAATAAPLAQAGMGMLGNAVGGQAGGLLGGLGGAVGQGLTSVFSGGSPAAAGMGVLGAAMPGLQQMAGSFLSRL